MSRLKTALTIALVNVSVLSAGMAGAGISFQAGNFPQANQETIAFNQAGLIPGPALTVSGRTNQTATLVGFSSSENLLTSNNGQVRVAGADGAFNDLSIYLLSPHLDFSGLIFNLNTTNGNTGIAHITVHGSGMADAPYNFTLGNGANFLTILGTNGQRIGRVDINSNIGVNMININDGRQFRIGDIQDPPAELPEPGVVWLLGAGLAGIAVTRRSRAA